MNDHAGEQAWREKWLKPEERPLHLQDITCATCGYIPDWLEMVGGATPLIAHAQGISRERQQSHLLFHLQSKGHKA